MTDRTAEIIMVLKGNHDMNVDYKYEHFYYYDVIATYLHHDCDIPLEWYYSNQGKNCIYRVIEKAVTDYISTADQRVSFMSDYFRNAVNSRIDNILNGNLDINQNTPEEIYYYAWCEALENVQVRDNGKYINGFTEDNTADYIVGVNR